MTTKTMHKRRHGNKKMMCLIDQYKKAHQEDGDETNLHLVAPWVIKEGLWKQPPMDPEENLRRQMSRAMRNEYITDPQGRDVRLHHPVIIEEMTPSGVRRRSRWYTIFDAPADHMRLAAQLRRRASLSDAVQLKLDYESWNDNNKFGDTLPPLDFDFNKDIEEMNLPTDYPDELPEETEEE